MLKTIAAPSGLRQDRKEAVQKKWLVAIENLSTNDVYTAVHKRPDSVATIVFGEFNVHGGSAPTATQTVSEAHYAHALTSPIWAMAPILEDKRTSPVKFNITLDDLAQMYLLAIRSSQLSNSQRFDKVDELKKAIAGALASMYPQSNVLRYLAETILSSNSKGFKIFYIGQTPVMIIAPTAAWVLGSGEIFGVMNAYVYYDKFAIKFLDMLLTQRKPEDKRPEFPDDITIGMDPELEGYFIENGEVDFDAQCLAYEVISNRNSAVGTDGHSDIFEFRPTHSKEPLVVVSNTKRCFELLAYQLAAKDRDTYILSGGGVFDSLGGHIHIGGSFFSNINTGDVGEFFGNIMDDFVYFPIRDTMPGAMRQWGCLPTMGHRSSDGHHSKFLDKRPAVVFKKIEDMEKRRTIKATSYDQESQFRFTEYGFEYRSLPSFIVSPELTEIVLTMAKSVATKMLECYNKNEGFSYNKPPKKDDYLRLFPEELYHSFMRYINGNNNKIFLSNALDNWGYNISALYPVILVQGDMPNALPYGMALSQQIRPYIKRLKDKYKELAELKKIPLSIQYPGSMNGKYAAVTTTGELSSRDEIALRQYFGRFGASTPASAEAKVLINSNSCSGVDVPIIEGIAMALASKVGELHFNRIRAGLGRFFNIETRGLQFDENMVLKNASEAEVARAILTGIPRFPYDHVPRGAWMNLSDDTRVELLEYVREHCSSMDMRGGCTCYYCRALREVYENDCECCEDDNCPRSEINQVMHVDQSYDAEEEW